MLPDAVRRQLYDAVLGALVERAPESGVTVLARERLAAVYESLAEFDQGTIESLLKAARADVEIICDASPVAGGITLSCAAIDLLDAVNVAHAVARFTLESPAALLDIAIAEVAARLVERAREAGPVDRMMLLENATGARSDLGLFLAERLRGELDRRMAERMHREESEARAAAVLRTAPEKSAQPFRYRVNGTFWRLDGERIRLEARLTHAGRSRAAAGADIMLASLPPELAEGGVQRGLTQLGHDVGVADGVFGRRTRGGIMGYQREKGLAETGYLTCEQYERLVAVGEEAQRRVDEVRRKEEEERWRAEERRAAAEAEAKRRREEETRRKAEEARRIAEIAPEMVRISGGCFRMGSPDERQHRVCVEGFSIGKHEVTFAEYDRFAVATGWSRPDDEGWGRGRRPVINVTWHDATAYARWLSEETGRRYRLPSEAEWEYAARAGTLTAYPWGNHVGSGRANCEGCGSRWDDRQTAPVGSFEANAWGLHDTVGNVWEWTGRRVIRGGSWGNDPGGCVPRAAPGSAPAAGTAPWGSVWRRTDYLYAVFCFLFPAFPFDVPSLVPVCPAGARQGTGRRRPGRGAGAGLPFTRERKAPAIPSSRMTVDERDRASAHLVQDCHDLLRWLIPHLDKFPRARRFTLGERLEAGLLDVLAELADAAYRRDKTAALRRANRASKSCASLVPVLGCWRSCRHGATSTGRTCWNRWGRKAGGWLRARERAA